MKNSERETNRDRQTDMRVSKHKLRKLEERSYIFVSSLSKGGITVNPEAVEIGNVRNPKT